MTTSDKAVSERVRQLKDENKQRRIVIDRLVNLQTETHSEMAELAISISGYLVARRQLIDVCQEGKLYDSILNKLRRRRRELGFRSTSIAMTISALTAAYSEGAREMLRLRNPPTALEKTKLHYAKVWGDQRTKILDDITRTRTMIQTVRHRIDTGFYAECRWSVGELSLSHLKETLEQRYVELEEIDLRLTLLQ